MENAVLKNMIERRSCRAYKPEQITVEEMEFVLEAGAWAANGKGLQSPIFVAVQDKATRNQLSRMNAEILGKPEMDPFYGAPTVIVVLARADVPTHVEDGALAMGNMLNAAASIGLGSCWIHRARQAFESEEGKNLLKAWGIADEYVGIGHCILGYPAAAPAEGAPRKEGRVYEIL